MHFGTITYRHSPIRPLGILPLESLSINAEIPPELQQDFLNKLLTHLKNIDRESLELNYTPLLNLHQLKPKDNQALTYYIKHNADKSPPILNIISSSGESVIITHDPSNPLEPTWHYQRLFGFFRTLTREINKRIKQ